MLAIPLKKRKLVDTKNAASTLGNTAGLPKRPKAVVPNLGEGASAGRNFVGGNFRRPQLASKGCLGKVLKPPVAMKATSMTRPLSMMKPSSISSLQPRPPASSMLVPRMRPTPALPRIVIPGSKPSVPTKAKVLSCAPSPSSKVSAIGTSSNGIPLKRKAMMNTSGVPLNQQLKRRKEPPLPKPKLVGNVPQPRKLTQSQRSIQSNATSVPSPTGGGGNVARRMMRPQYPQMLSLDDEEMMTQEDLDFIDDEMADDKTWKEELRRVTRYDPRKYEKVDQMEATESALFEIEHEERISASIAHKEDEMERLKGLI